jgi:hypothetical protein
MFIIDTPACSIRKTIDSRYLTAQMRVRPGAALYEARHILNRGAKAKRESLYSVCGGLTVFIS